LYKHIKIENLLSYRGGFFFNSLSITIISFAFHPIIPTISKYLKYNIKDIILVILIGSCIPVFIYIIWEIILLGIIPITGSLSISIAYKNNMTFYSLLFPMLNNYLIIIAMWFFSLSAIITSFLGVSIASVDFFIDAFNLKKNIYNIAKVILLTYLPPIFFYLKFQEGFLTILDYAGIFLIILIGILPISMTYVLKYNRSISFNFSILNNKYILLSGLFIYLIIIVFILIKNIGYIEIVA